MDERRKQMTYTPEKIFATGSSTTGSWNFEPLPTRLSPAQTEYTRTDVADAREVAAINLGRYFADTANTQQARIKELEAALLTVRNDAIQEAIGCCCPHVDDDQMDAQAKTQCADAIAALKGENK
jgi:hypothetical protein